MGNPLESMKGFPQRRNPSGMPDESDDEIQETVVFILSLVASIGMAVVTVVMGAENHFGRVAGGPVGTGLVSAGFGVAYGLSIRKKPVGWAYITLALAGVALILTLLLATMRHFGVVSGAPAGAGIATAGFAIAYGVRMQDMPRFWAYLSMGLSVTASVFAVLMGAFPDLGKVAGAPAGLGAVAAGFTIAYGFAIIQMPRGYAYISLGLAILMAVLAVLMGALPHFGRVPGGAEGVGVASAGYVVAYALAIIGPELGPRPPTT